MYDVDVKLTVLAAVAARFFVIFWVRVNTDDVYWWPGPNEYGYAKIL